MDPIEFEGHNVVYAKDQPEYFPLPAHKSPEGKVTTVWKLTDEEIKEINKTGKLRLEILTFNAPLQPLQITVLHDAEEIVR